MIHSGQAGRQRQSGRPKGDSTKTDRQAGRQRQSGRPKVDRHTGDRDRQTDIQTGRQQGDRDRNTGRGGRLGHMEGDRE